MRRNIKLLAYSTLSIFFISCAGTYQPHPVKLHEQQLADQLQRQISVPELETALVGIMVQSAETGEILFEHNANTLFLPASNEKIPTAVATLLNLGENFQYETAIYTNGKIEDGILKGDLIVVGSGDPTIGYRSCENEKDSCFAFINWADSLKAMGINKIDGNIVGVDDVFDDESIGYGWTLDNLPFSYSAPIGGLTFNENFVTIRIEADSFGENIYYTILPDFEYFNLFSTLKIDREKTDIKFNRIFNTNDIEIDGKIRPGRSYTQRLSIHNPTLYFVSALKYELLNLGIEISGDVFDADELIDQSNSDSSVYLFSHYSDSLKNILRVLLKESQNLYAECMVKSLGHYFGSEGSFAEGEKILKQTLNQFGLEENSYAFKDGSGMSRYSYISPAQLTKILRHVYFHPLGSTFRDCLPIAGVDGTIGHRLKGTVAAGKIFAKTGTVSNVRCLSGYATTADGETLIFSTMFNNFLCSVQVVLDVQDQICMLLSSFSRK